jgi:SAM-dependent methyltransferase
MSAFAERARAALGVLRSGHATARALSIGDSRSFVRSQFLAAAVRVDLLPLLETPRALDEIAEHLGAQRSDRLEGFLAVGTELGELRCADGRYRLRGRRARAIGGGDELLTAHYRSMLDYQTSPYAELSALLRGEPGTGLSDLEEHATVIADVSLAAAPFVTPFLERVVVDRRPRRVLDVGCGTGVYTEVLLGADPQVLVDGIDLAADVIDACRQRVGATHGAARAELGLGDARTWVPPDDRRYDVITLNNNIYYFDPVERVALYERLGSLLADGGELVVVTMLWPGSIASAHLHFMLIAQAGAAALPALADLRRDLATAGFVTVEVDALVPTEPFVAVRARRAP